MNELTGKVCFVTGGSRGIGAAIVGAMAEAGAAVAFSYNQSKDLALGLAAAIREKGAHCQAYPANIASAGEMETAVRQAVSELGPVSILVNNAGINRDKSFLKMTRAMWDEVMRVNLDGVFVATQLMAGAMVEAGWGRIINISSVVGQAGNFGQANYAATKGAMIAFTKSLARELARKGVTVNAVAPGFIETDMVRGMPQAVQDQARTMIPQGRFGRVGEVADAVVFLASPRSAYITGQILGVNGGLYM